MKTATIGIDLGTSGLKAIAINPLGQPLAEAIAGYPLLTPNPGWTEQNPSEWIMALQKTLSEINSKLAEQNIRPVAIGLSGQMHGMVVLDKEGKVIRPAPLWNDQRTGGACVEIEAKIPRLELIRRTGNPAVTGFQLPKLVWLRKAEPENFAKVDKVLLPKDYLGYVLTNNFATEPSDASGIGALNLETQDWDLEVLSALDLDPKLFPGVIPSSAVVGNITSEWAKSTGLPEGLPVIAGAGDNAAAAIGLGVSSLNPGTGSISLGTSGVLFSPVEKPTPDPQGRVHMFCHADGKYLFLGVTLAAAGSLQWFRDTLAPGVEFSTLMAEAEQIPAGSEGLVFMPYLAGERSPYLDPNLRGSWLGLSLAHKRGHMVRSLIEGVAFSLRETLDVMRPLTQIDKMISIGGGARSDLWLKTIRSALGVSLHSPEVEEGPARGAAILALVGAGVFENLEAALGSTKPNISEINLDANFDLDQAFSNYQRGYQSVRTYSAPKP